MTWANQADLTKERRFVFNESKIKEVLVKYLRAIEKEIMPDEDDCDLNFLNVGDGLQETGEVIITFTDERLETYLESIDENTEEETWDTDEVLPCGKASCPVDNKEE
jgi:hypothetical protein